MLIQGPKLSILISCLFWTEKRANYCPFFPKLMGSGTHCSKIDGFQGTHVTHANGAIVSWLFTFGCNGGRWVSLGCPCWWLDLTGFLGELLRCRSWRRRIHWRPDIGSRTNSWRWCSSVFALAAQIIFEMMRLLKLFITNPAKPKRQTNQNYTRLLTHSKS